MAKQYTLNERDSKRVQDALRFVERNKNLKPDYRRRGRGATPASNIHLAKTQEASQADGVISVKFLDSEGEETGEPFDVYAFLDKRIEGDEADMRQYGPWIADDDIVVIKNIGGDWYLDQPRLDQNRPLAAETKEAAQGNQFISVQLLDENDVKIGTAFDAECLFPDGATAANTCFPTVGSSKKVLVSKLSDGTWYIVNPTFIDKDDC